MPEKFHLTGRLLLLTSVLLSCAAVAQVVLYEGTNISVDVSGDGRLAFDLLGSIWIVPVNGGKAESVTDTAVPARRPRWSPDNRQILFQTETPRGNVLDLLTVNTSQSTTLSRSGYSDYYGAWHPGGERVVFSSARHQTGFDLWELDIPTGLTWRLTDISGDETEAAWSADGRHLAYIHAQDGQWTLMLRRFGQPDASLYVSEEPLSSLAWRPDGSLLTFLQQHGEQLKLNMLILSDPPLVRQIIDGEDYFRFPVSWLGRQQFFYTADGAIKTRGFGDRLAKRVSFTAEVGQPASRSSPVKPRRDLPIVSAPDSRLVVRGERLFDGVSPNYRQSLDVLIENGIITAVENRRDWPDAVVLDLGDVSVVPGYVDAYSALPDGDPRQVGAELLAFGITSIVTDDRRPVIDGKIWESEATPGPRLLFASAAASEVTADACIMLATLASADHAGTAQKNKVRSWQQQGIPVLAENWSVGLSVGADLLLGADALPASPLGKRYQDVQLAVASGPITLVSGLADAGTPGLQQLFDSRQAQLFGYSLQIPRRYASTPQLPGRSSSVVLGSKPNGLPAGLALHAEMRALKAAGLQGHQVLRAAGANAARVLGLEAQIGRIAPGALADLVLLAGDPLNNISDTLNIVAVVRNGRFYSLVSLLERATVETAVE